METQRASPAVLRWQRMVSRMSSFLTGGAGDITPEQKARVAEMERDYEEWTRQKRDAAASKKECKEPQAGVSSV